VSALLLILVSIDPPGRLSSNVDEAVTVQFGRPSISLDASELQNIIDRRAKPIAGVLSVPPALTSAATFAAAWTSLFAIRQLRGRRGNRR
jgi:hypothetical protein